MKLSNFIARNVLPALALVALPILLLAQGSIPGSPTTVTVLGSGELKITGDFVVELTESAESTPIGEVWVNRQNHTTRGERGFVVEDNGFRITGESGGVGYYSHAIIGSPTIVIAKVVDGD